MPPKNVQAVLAGVDAFNRRDLDAAVKDYAEHVQLVDHPRGMTTKTRAEAKDWIAEWITAFPDSKLSTEEVIDAGDTVVVQLSFTGTNTGTFGPFPATGRRIAAEGCEIFRFDAKGLIVKDEVYYDQLGMLIQLGHAQPPA